MSKVVWMIDMVYYKKSFKTPFSNKEEKPELTMYKVQIIAFSKDEAKELIAKTNKEYSGASVYKTKKPQIRGLTLDRLRLVEEILLKRLEAAIMDLETHPNDNVASLKKRISVYREVGRYIFNLTDEWRRK